mmetsp:Transcript_15219/g.47502  ORF Transcript_15219/g.47502 Transcript_15219/m.47502 type:complete len:452 (-) Transcript_15219:804-2159(-)
MASFNVWITLFFLVIFAATNNVLSKVTYDAYGQRYSYFVNQASNAAYLLVTGTVLAYKSLFTNDINPSMKSFPTKSLVAMGCLDAAASFLAAVGAVGTPGSWQMLLNQTLIPVTMALSALTLHHRYGKLSVAGATIIVSGAVLAVGPALAGEHTVGVSVSVISCIVFWSAILPNSLSSIFKEYSLKDKEVSLDVYYLTFFVGLYQTLATFALMPVVALHGFGGFSIHESLTSMWDGLRCTVHRHDGCPSANAEWLFLAYVAANFAYNILGLRLTRSGSAALAAVAYTLQLPFTNLLFSVCSIMGDECEPFTKYSAAGLVVVVVGFALHSYGEERTSKATHAADADSDRAPLRPSPAAHHMSDPSLPSLEPGANFYLSRLPDFVIGKQPTYPTVSEPIAIWEAAQARARVTINDEHSALLVGTAPARRAPTTGWGSADSHRGGADWDGPSSA